MMPPQANNEIKFDKSKSLEELENNFWKDYDFETPLVAKCHQYRKIPVNKLTIEELRLLIGQNVGLPFLIPIALEKLKQNVFAEGDYYEGDLLIMVLKSDLIYWENNRSNVENLLEIIHDTEHKIKAFDTTDEIKEHILNVCTSFKKIWVK